MPDPIRRSLVALPLLLCARRGRAEAFALEAVMARLASVAERRARFSEERRFAALTQPMASRGRLFYRRPDYLEMNKEWPVAERTVIDGTRLIVTEPGSNDPPHVMDFSGRPELGTMFEAMRAPLAGDLGALLRVFAVSGAGSVAAWSMTLVPRDPGAAALMRSANLAGRGDWIDAIQIVQANGDESRMQIEPV